MRKGGSVSTEVTVSGGLARSGVMCELWDGGGRTLLRLVR